MTRIDGRQAQEMRPITIDTDYLKHPEGSVLITVGETKVICTASIEERVPPFMRNSGKGWIAAEYSMLPRATEQRNIREAAKGKLSGRTMEIQRLIGRSLRSVVDLTKIGERTIWIDCDVIQADGGTRTASITGAFVAMTMAVKQYTELKKIKSWPVTDFLAAVSVGVDPEQTELLDLCYKEDAAALVDMNIVMTGKGEFVELQGTGEEASYSRAQLNRMLDLGEKGMQELFDLQRELLGTAADEIMNAKEAE
ncbi:ribonuclease PH [Salibacterium salarium]|uniref:Ribonuclease PH n=1 Tax=Salibacterium salarium TaxID=284579 RepID=A0A3R9Q351_9BACI|nr:ribonuclease PH [Salibacterium salarium]RSL32590.1 ribonuclease PH [Salibacterium salarium]